MTENNQDKSHKIIRRIIIITLLILLLLIINKGIGIDLTSGGGWGIFDLIEVIVDGIAYIIILAILWIIILAITTHLLPRIIRNKNNLLGTSYLLTISVSIAYLILVNFNLNPKKTFDFKTKEEQLDWENDFIEEYKKIVSSQKTEFYFPTKEILNHDKNRILNEIYKLNSIFKTSSMSDSLQRDSLISLLNKVYDFNWIYEDTDSIIKRSLPNRNQIEVITYSPDYKYILGLHTFRGFNWDDSTNFKLYETVMFIGIKNNKEMNVYFFPTQYTAEGNCVLPQNAKIFALANIYLVKIPEVIPYEDPYSNKNMDIVKTKSPAKKAFWSTTVFRDTVVNNKTYKRFEIEKKWIRNLDSSFYKQSSHFYFYN